MPRTGMDGDTGGLIHYYQVFILVDEVQGAGGRDNAAAPLRSSFSPSGHHLIRRTTVPDSPSRFFKIVSTLLPSSSGEMDNSNRRLTAFWSSGSH